MKHRSVWSFLFVFFFISCIQSSAFSQLQSESPWSIYGGISIPVNEFASVSGSDAGFAKLGYSIGVEYRLSVDVPIDYPVGLLTSLTLSSNVLDEKAILSKAGRPNIRATVESGSYYSVFVLTGPEIAYQLSSEINLHGAIQGGAFIGTSPAYEAFSSGFILSQTRATSSALAFGLSGGAQISNDFLKNFSIGIQYIYTAPRYNLTRFTNGNPVNFAYQQPTSFFLILFGFGL